MALNGNIEHAIYMVTTQHHQDGLVTKLLVVKLWITGDHHYEVAVIDYAGGSVFILPQDNRTRFFAYDSRLEKVVDLSPYAYNAICGYRPASLSINQCGQMDEAMAQCAQSYQRLFWSKPNQAPQLWHNAEFRIKPRLQFAIVRTDEIEGQGDGPEIDIAVVEGSYAMAKSVLTAVVRHETDKEDRKYKVKSYQNISPASAKSIIGDLALDAGLSLDHLVSYLKERGVA